MNNSKFWLVFMCGPNSLEDLRELIEPIIQYFDGIVAVLHTDKGSPESDYLESKKGAGEIIYLKYTRRHDFSRQHYLYCGPIKDGDWCCQIDILERLNPVFANDLHGHMDYFSKQGVNLVYYYNKPFMFEYNESLQYTGNPHEGLRRNDGKGVAIELANIFPIENNVRFNVRPLKRPDPFHFVNHYMKYYLFPWGSNHCLLGLEKNGDPQKLFPEREKKRLDFIREIRKLGIEQSIEGFADYLLSAKELDPNIKRCINNEKIINDFYRYHVLKDRSFKDNHNWQEVVKV